VNTLVERIDNEMHGVDDRYADVRGRLLLEARATITRLEGERDEALKDNKKLRMMMEAREKLQDAFGVDMHQNATEAALEFAQREIDAVARAEAAEATLAEATSATMMAEMRADKLQAENARLREALTKIAAVRPEIVTHAPEGFAPVLSCQQIAKAALSGDLTNG